MLLAVSRSWLLVLAAGVTSAALVACNGLFDIRARDFAPDDAGESPDAGVSDDAALDPCAARQSWDLGADFSPADNPTCAWTYGWTRADGGEMHCGSPALRAGLESWIGTPLGGTAQGNPSVLFNATSQTIYVKDSVPFVPGATALHPGPNGERAVARWTPPEAGSYAIQARFHRLDIGSERAYILRDGAQLLGEEVPPQGQVITFAQTLCFVKCEIVDFAVGFGVAGTFNSNTTSVTIHIDRAHASDADCQVANDDAPSACAPTCQ